MKDRTLDQFVAEHCDRLLLPDYWQEFDFVDVSSAESFRRFFEKYFDHTYEPDRSPSHASGSQGFAHDCETGEISPSTRERVLGSRNMEIYLQVSRSHPEGRPHPPRR